MLVSFKIMNLMIVNHRFIFSISNDNDTFLGSFKKKKERKVVKSKAENFDFKP